MRACVCVVLAVTGSLFDSPEFIADIHPWLLTVDADMLREAAQQNQLLRTFAIVASLENILKREGPVAHNKKLIQIISADELNGYKRLCHVVAEMGFHTRARQMLSQLREKDRPCLGKFHYYCLILTVWMNMVYIFLLLYAETYVCP